MHLVFLTHMASLDICSEYTEEMKYVVSAVPRDVFHDVVEQTGMMYRRDGRHSSGFDSYSGWLYEERVDLLASRLCMGAVPFAGDRQAKRLLRR